MNASKEQKYVYDRIAYDGSKEQEGVVIGVDSLNSDSELDDNNWVRGEGGNDLVAQI